jgi:photosystem II stability/assembly factor-like uncharacterized protein
MITMVGPLKRFSIPALVVLLSLLPGLEVAGASGMGPGASPDAGHWARTGGPATGALDFLIDPVDPKVAYAATGENYVLKSLDAGRTWTPMHQGLNDTNVVVLVLDPTDNLVLYAGANTYGQGDGVFKSTDGGATWVRKNQGLPDDADIYSITVDPTNHLIIYAGTTNPDSLFKSTDGADSWSVSDGGLPDDYIVRSIAVDPDDPSTVYAGTEKWGSCAGGVYKSTDAGAAWSPASSVELEELLVSSLAIDPGQHQTVYAGAFDSCYDRKGGVFKSSDGGESWTKVLKEPNVNALAMDPRHSRILFAATETGMFKSTDRGARWRRADQGILGPSVLAVEVNPMRSQVTLAATGGVLFRTTDRGSTWVALTNVIGGSVQALAADPIDGDTIYAASGEWVFKTTDDGRTWALITNGLPDRDIYALKLDPTDPQIVYAAPDQSGVYKSIDAGSHWAPANAGISDIEIHSLAVDPVNPQTIYAGGETGIYKSMDAGQTWAYHVSGLEYAGYLEALVVDPSNPDVVYAGTYRGGCCSQPRAKPALQDEDGVFKSMDGGMTWTRSSDGINHEEASSVTALAIDPSSPGTLYAAVSCTYYEECGATDVYKTTDGASSWSSALYVSSLDWFTSILIDPDNPDIVYAGHVDRGVYRSMDAGTSWETINDGLGQSANTLEITQAGVLYAGSDGVFKFLP